MGFAGVGLGVVVAFLWGAGDILATIAAHRLSAFKTACISQIASFWALLWFSASAFWSPNLSFTLSTLELSAMMGIFTGLCAALGYLSLYKALAVGPVAITGPLTATSPIFTLVLSAFLLQEHLALMQVCLVVAGILGIILASTNLPELSAHLRKSGSLWTEGVRWAIVATLAFGVLDFGIGASVSVTNWFLPGLWTRFFTIVFFLLVSYGWRKWPLLRVPAEAQSKAPFSFSLPAVREMAALWRPASPVGLGILLALLVGLIEAAAVLTFSVDTRLATTGVTSAIASSYGLFVMIFGMIVYRERLAANQFVGIAMFMLSLFLLTL